MPAGADVEVLDRAGVVITARGHPERAGQPFDPALLSALAGSKEPVEAPGPDRVPRVHALQRVLGRGGEPVIQVVAGLPTSAVIAPVNRIMVLSLVAFVLVAALTLAIAGWAGEVLLARKLRVVIGAARRLSAGDIGSRTHLEPGGGELGDLVHAFDEMAASLERQVAERSRLEEQLRQSQKMEAVGRLAGGVAHDFNNLLTAVLSSARMIENDLPAGHPARQDVAEIISAGERAAALTSQLLAFSRRQRLAPRVIALADVVRGLEQMLRRILGETVRLEVVTHARGEVLADPSQLEQVIVNLVVNARDAMPDGGRLTITVREQEAARPGARPRPVPAGGAARHPLGGRHRPGHGRGDPGPHLRALLHHQGAGEGDRPRPLDGLRDRGPERRGHPRALGAGRRHRVPGLPAAPRRAAPGPAGDDAPAGRGPSAGRRPSCWSRTTTRCGPSPGASCSWPATPSWRHRGQAPPWRSPSATPGPSTCSSPT